MINFKTTSYFMFSNYVGKGYSKRLCRQYEHYRQKVKKENKSIKLN